MELRTFLDSHPNLRKENALYYQRDLQHGQPFEKEYTSVRKKENRIYSDEEVRALPQIQDGRGKEWLIRKASADRLSKYLTVIKPTTVLEVGCGNGWLCNYLSQNIPADFCGVDINESELLQAARLFSTGKKFFVYSDIFSNIFNGFTFDAVIVASAIQYFSDLESVINQLMTMAKPGGEIHLIDSPFYKNQSEAEKAHKRSIEYFQENDQPQMADFYFHHTYTTLKTFNPDILYTPKSGLQKIFGARDDSPFPWIRISKNQGS